MVLTPLKPPEGSKVLSAGISWCCGWLVVVGEPIGSSIVELTLDEARPRGEFDLSRLFWIVDLTPIALEELATPER